MVARLGTYSDSSLLRRLALSREENWGFCSFNTDEDLLLVVLLEVKEQDGDPFTHIFGQDRLDRLNVVIIRNLHGIWKRDRNCNWKKKTFVIDEKMKSRKGIR